MQGGGFENLGGLLGSAFNKDHDSGSCRPSMMPLLLIALIPKPQALKP